MDQTLIILFDADENAPQAITYNELLTLKGFSLYHQTEMLRDDVESFLAELKELLPEEITRLQVALFCVAQVYH